MFARAVMEDTDICKLTVGKLTEANGNENIWKITHIYQVEMIYPPVLQWS